MPRVQKKEEFPDIYQTSNIKHQTSTYGLLVSSFRARQGAARQHQPVEAAVVRCAKSAVDSDVYQKKNALRVAAGALSVVAMKSMSIELSPAVSSRKSPHDNNSKSSIYCTVGAALLFPSARTRITGTMHTCGTSLRKRMMPPSLGVVVLHVQERLL